MHDKLGGDYLEAKFHINRGGDCTARSEDRTPGTSKNKEATGEAAIASIAISASI
ncbi:hypothetical protein MYX65_10735 [Acidobacteria bacterium AH-259-L09]|nr:hypothetical protein [Acidobacteria bacterium AH-259-L09]